MAHWSDPDEPPRDFARSYMAVYESCDPEVRALLRECSATLGYRLDLAQAQSVYRAQQYSDRAAMRERLGEEDV